MTAKINNIMNKNDLVTSVAENTGFTKADALKAVDGVIDSITQSLRKNKEVRIVGFGKFSVAQRAARVSRNPRTGEKINTPASRQPKFHAGKGLKDAIA